jgi:hypothetical protein
LNYEDSPAEVGNFKQSTMSNILDISQITAQVGDFYEFDITRDLIRSHKFSVNGYTKIRPNITYEKKSSRIQVEFSERGT